MSPARRPVVWPRVLMAAVALGLAGVGVAVVRSVLTRRPPAPAPEAAPAVAPGQTQVMENARHFQVEGGSKRIEMTFRRQSLGTDGLFHLEGDVEITDYGKTREGRKVRIRTERLAFDRDKRNFWCQDKALVEDGETTLEAAGLHYDRDRELLTSDSPSTVRTGRISATGGALWYHSGGEVLRLRGGVRMERAPAAEGEAPLVLTAESLEYRRKGRAGDLAGPVTLTRGNGVVTAGSATFAVNGTEDWFQTLRFEGGARARFAASGPSKGPQRLSAGEILMVARAGGPELSYIQALGEAAMGIESGGRGHDVAAGRILLYFEPDGATLSTFHADGGATLVRSDDEDAGARVTAKGDVLEYAGASGNLRVVGSAAGKALLASPRSDLEASEASFNLRSGGMSAKGGFRLVMKPSEAAAPRGLFSGDRPIFVTGESMQFTTARRRFEFAGKVRAWQDREYLASNGMDLLEDTGFISARGGVETVLYRPAPPAKAAAPGGPAGPAAATVAKPEAAAKPAAGATPGAEAADERVRAGGTTMSFNAKKRALFFDGAAFLETPRVRMEARAMVVRLREAGRDLESATARGGVVIRQGDSEGRGDEAVYDVANDALTLRPGLLLQKGKGEARGAKLTFHPSDGRIVIENDPRDRSVTIIK